MPMRDVYNTPMRRFRCFVFDRQLEGAKFTSVKTKAYSYAFYVYVSCPPLPFSGLSASFDIAKIQKIIGSQNNLFQF